MCGGGVLLYPATSKCTFFLPSLWLSFLCFSWLDFLGMPRKIGQKACRGGMCGWGGIGGEINIAEICTARNNRLMSTGTAAYVTFFGGGLHFLAKGTSTPPPHWLVHGIYPLGSRPLRFNTVSPMQPIWIQKHIGTRCIHPIQSVSNLPLYAA